MISKLVDRKHLVVTLDPGNVKDVELAINFLEGRKDFLNTLTKESMAYFKIHGYIMGMGFTQSDK
jgi:hypothetical protein